MATVRLATVSDAEEIASVHVRAWQVAYRGQVPDALIDGLDVKTRAGQWRESLTKAREDETGEGIGAGRVLVLEGERELIGVSAVGPARDSEQTELGELWMIYLAPASWGTGLGNVLLEASVDELRRLGYTEAYLWVLDTNNRARRFYEKAGWCFDGGEKLDQREGALLREVRYRCSLD